MNHPATILSKRTIAENTMEVTFVISGKELFFRAGQYVTVCIPSLRGARIPDRCHDFSIASSPSSSKEISIAFRMSQSIFKSALLELPISSGVEIDGPRGVLTLPEYPQKVSNLMFIAGGIGITPILSMIRYATETLSPQKITLLYYNTSLERTAYHEELLRLQRVNKNFTYHDLLGTPEEKDFTPYINGNKVSLWYIVGVPQMVMLSQQILSRAGILDTQIRMEEFSGY